MTGSPTDCVDLSLSPSRLGEYFTIKPKINLTRIKVKLTNSVTGSDVYWFRPTFSLQSIYVRFTGYVQNWEEKEYVYV